MAETALNLFPFLILPSCLFEPSKFLNSIFYEQNYLFVVAPLLHNGGGVTKAQDLPVKLSTDTERHYYYVKNVRNAAYYVTVDPSGSIQQQLGSANTFTANKEKALFTFEKAGEVADELTIKVNINGTLYPVGVATQENMADGARVSAFGNATPEYGIWKLEANSAQTGYVFIFKKNGNDWVQSSWNMYGGAGAKISTYQKSDGGSDWSFEEYKDTSEQYTALLKKASNMYNTAIVVWAKGQEADNALKNALVDKENPTQQDLDNLQAAINAYTNLPVEQMNAISTTFKNKMHSTYMQVGEGQYASKLTVGAQHGEKAVWEIKPVSGNTAKLYNPATQQYIAKMNNGELIATNKRLNLTANEADAAIYTFDLNEKDGGTYYFSASDNSTEDANRCLHGTDWGAVVRWGINADASQWIINNTIAVNYDYYIDNEKIASKVAYQSVGDSYAEPLALAYATITYEGQGTITNDTKNIRVNVTENLPFEKTTDLNNNAKWYAIDMHSNQNAYMWEYAADGQDIKTTVPAGKYTDLDVLNNDKYFWCFKGNVVNGFEIYNKAAGTEKSLNTTTGKAQITAAAEHTLWRIVPASQGIQGATCFTTNGSQYLNHTSEQVVGYHTAPDHGSSCRFFTPASFAINKAETFANIPEDAVGGYLNVHEIEPKLTAAEADVFSFEKAIALGEAIKALKPNDKQVTAGKYYRFKKANQNFYIGAKDTETPFCKEGINPKQQIDFVWKAETATNGGFYLKNANVDAYLGQPVDAPGKTLLATEQSNAGVYTFDDKGNATFAIVSGEKALQREEGGETANCLNYWGTAPEGRIKWYIIEATDVEVALNTANGASYATTYLPFAVSNVEGATAYIGQKQGESTLRATAIEAGIPANTGVILKGAANVDKAVLTLGKATSNVQNDALTGTLVEKDYTNELVFGVNNDVVGFYSMAAGKKIGANKAYLAGGAATQAMKLVFDGDVTGIENVMDEAADANAPIYDLTGRRVKKAVKGGLYIQNGKKFIAQ